VCFVPAVGAWLVTRWDDVTFVASRPEVFGPATASPLRDTCGENVLTVAGGAHRRLRAAMEPLLRRDVVDAMAPGIVENVARPLWDDLAPRGAAELMEDFFEPVSVLSLGWVLGLRDIDAGTLRRWFSELARAGSNYEADPAKRAAGEAISGEIDEVIGPRIAQLRARPDDGLISAMLQADGALTDREVLSNLKLILLGGMQEPGHAAGNIAWALLTHPEQAQLVRAEPARVEAALEEGLRWISPVGTATREVREPVALGGVRLDVGERVAVVLSSANRDERRFERADRFDLLRADIRHRAFGIGGHFCVGHWLARHEIRRPLAMVFGLLDDLSLDPADPPVMRGWEFRGPTRLPVRWTRG
jgi:cytochrome P450